MFERIRKVLGTQASEEWELPTSMIDVVFLLLIFFMCASQFRTVEKSLDSLLPRNRGSEERIPKSIPVLFIAGEQDPVGESGEGVRRLAARYRQAGLRVTERIYPGARHEVFNETNRDEVDRDLLAWLEQVLQGEA